jgi:pimeloyl-ACP methyl ester carboxylesterase
VLRFPSSDGVHVAAYDLGGDGPPLLLAHATGFHAHVFLPLAAHLRDAFHCFAFDERGHGDTIASDGLDYDWRGFADDAAAVVRGLGLERPFAFGHSAGGAALLLAEAAAPGSFRALYCYEPVVMPVDPPLGPQENSLSEGARRRRDVFASRDDAFANYASKAPFDALSPEALRAYVDYGFADAPEGSVRLRCRPEVEAAIYRMGSAHDAFARFGAIRCPVTVACGERTDAFTPRLVEQQAAALPYGRVEVLPGLGHFGPLQDPAAVAGAVVRAFTHPPSDPPPDPPA